MNEFTANTTEPTTDPSDRTTSPQWPKALLYTSREEFYGQDADHQPLELIVKEGMTENTCVLPEDLQGHVFIVGPVGTEDSPRYEGSSYVVEPAQDGWTPLFNGDGMIYRLDFHQTPQTDSDADRTEVGKAWMASRIVKTPDYYADLALETNPRYQKDWPEQYPFLKFHNFGLSRLSINVGNRNSLNTAFLPMKFSDGSERLLVTWDGGRPYEIDPRTLDPIAPIGWNKQWKPMTQALDIFKMPFPFALSTAHPVFDTHTDEMFTVNVGKSQRNLIDQSRYLPFWAIKFAKRYLKNQNSFLRRILDFGIRKWVQCIKFCAFLDWLFEDIFITPDLNGENFVYLTHWTGSGTDVTQWQVLDENERPLKIRQSPHQMALTRDYVILSDSAFKLTLSDLLPYLDIQQSAEVQKLLWRETENHNEFERILKQRQASFLEFLREHLSYEAFDYTDIYIIPRKNLQPGAFSVTAKKITIEPETPHFLADYENPEGKISLYVAHSNASDPAEFIHKVDESYYQEPKITQALQERSGATVAPMDVNKLGCWQIDVETGTTEHSLLPVEEAKEYLWSLAIYAWRGFQPDRFTDIYWNCWGAWQDLVSTFIVDMYDDYARRTVPMSEMLDDILKNCQPSNLLRMHIDRTSPSPKLGVPDAYEFPPGYFGNSPQFIPRLGSEDQTNGYISCIVIHSDRPRSDKCELWIFDARDLSSGPRYRLSHPQLNIGITVHSTWLSKLETPPVRTDYSVREDYADLVAATNSEAIETLFQDDVYPHFE